MGIHGWDHNNDFMFELEVYWPDSFRFSLSILKKSLKLLSDHRKNVRRGADNLLASKDTVSATQYFSDAAEKQTQRMREEKERRVEKEKNRRFAEQLEAAEHRRTEVQDKQRYWNSVNL